MIDKKTSNLSKKSIYIESNDNFLAKDIIFLLHLINILYMLLERILISKGNNDV
jgi:hypothetical protein